MCSCSCGGHVTLPSSPNCGPRHRIDPFFPLDNSMKLHPSHRFFFFDPPPSQELNTDRKSQSSAPLPLRFIFLPRYQIADIPPPSADHISATFPRILLGSFWSQEPENCFPPSSVGSSFSTGFVFPPFFFPPLFFSPGRPLYFFSAVPPFLSHLRLVFCASVPSAASFP